MLGLEVSVGNGLDAPVPLNPQIFDLWIQQTNKPLYARGASNSALKLSDCLLSQQQYRK